MAKTNRECYTCGQRYYHCSTCPSETKKETFYNMFCSERCSQIFKTLTDETFKRLTTSQCKDQLLKLNVSANENLKDGIKKHIAKVFDCKEPVVEVSEIVEEKEEIVLETIVTEEVLETENVIVEEIPMVETIEEEPVKKIEYVPKKNRKKKNSEVD